MSFLLKKKRNMLSNGRLNSEFLPLILLIYCLLITRCFFFLFVLFTVSSCLVLGICLFIACS